MNEIAEVLLTAPDNELDAKMKPLIEKWSESPTPLQVLEVLDYCINGGLASSFVVIALQATYDIACREHNTTHEEVVKNATWRNAHDRSNG